MSGAGDAAGDADPFPRKHPLEGAWTLWFEQKLEQKQKKPGLQPLHTFDSVEDFWW